VRRLIGSYFESFANFVPDAEEVVPGSEGRYLVLIKLHTRGQGSGAEVETQGAHVLTMRGGKVMRVEVYPDRDEAAVVAGVT
jgi:ketosteroid isomerase-like protein